MKKCNNCGLELGPSMLICPRCGYRFGSNHLNREEMRSVTPIPVPAPVILSRNITVPQLADFWRRVAAFLIDLFLVVMVSIPLMVVMPFFTSGIIWWFYSAIMESSAWQATLGKRILGLKVTDVNGVRLFFGRASARFFGKFLSSSILGIGFLMVLWTKHRQGLHDMVSGCLVYRRS